MAMTGKDTPAGFTLLHMLRGHIQQINRIAWSPDGRLLASSSFDTTVRIWNAQTGALLNTLNGHYDAVYSVAWSPDGQMLVSCSQDKRVLVWGAAQKRDYLLLSLGEHNKVGEHSKSVYDIAWVSGNAIVASCSEDQTVKVWMRGDRVSTKPWQDLQGHTSPVYSLARMPTTNVIASGSSRGPILLWDGSIVQAYASTVADRGTLRGHVSAVYSLAWSPDGKILASGSEDHTVRLWEFGSSHQTNILEGHTDSVTSVSFSYDGRLLASKSRDGTVCLWRTDTWENVCILNEAASGGIFAGIAFHPNLPTLATLGEKDSVLRIWELDIPVILGLAPKRISTYYVNAKVVLAGESGVGKTALGRSLMGQPFIPTESTHGRYVYKFDDELAAIEDGVKEQRETFLWDLAGQPSYRLIHQLHLDEVAVALLVIDAHSTTDPFAGVAHWARALHMAQRARGKDTSLLKKMLVGARTDRGGVKVSDERVSELQQKWGFDSYFVTSAKEGWSIQELAEAIRRAVPWDTLPRVTSTELFQRIKTFLIAQTETNNLLSTSDDLYALFLREGTSGNESRNLRAQFETCISLVEAQGLIRRLSFGGLILLQPELLDAYASALINAAREEPDELGSIPEEQVRAGNFYMPSDVRIVNKDKEKLLLIAMIEDLLRHEIALREQTVLVFPSEAVRTKPELPNPEEKTIVFRFEGAVQTIYTTLVVRLSLSGVFKKDALWKDATTFSARVGGLCGLLLRDGDEGLGQLTLFFDLLASEETRFQFEEYVKLHLERRALPGTVQRRRLFRCSSCREALTDSQVKRRRERKRTSVGCPVCDEEISLLDGEERLVAYSIHTSEAVRAEQLIEMDTVVDQGVKREVDLSTIQGKIATNDFDVFLCYHGIDNSFVKRIGERLKEKGLLPWLDEWELRPGLPWQRLLEAQIENIKTVAVFVGANGVGPWQQIEMEAFLREFVRRNCPVIPVILSDVSKEPRLPTFLGGMTWVDFRKRESDPMEQLIWGITGRKR